MTRTRTALVIGGGIAGPAAAMALQKAGIDPVVYEAHPTGADGVGVFLTLGSNGVDALRVLDADEPALARASRPRRSRCAAAPASASARAVTGVSAARRHDQPDHQARRPLPGAARRGESAAASRIEHGKRLVAAEETGDGVRAVFADGSEAAATC